MNSNLSHPNAFPASVNRRSAGLVRRSGLLFACWLLAVMPAPAQDIPIGYQGRLTEAGAPANGTYDMQFKLFDAGNPGAGIQQGNTIALPTVSVVNGAFVVAPLFEAAVFDGSPRFLEVSVRPGGSAAPYISLSPRQEVTPVPYAVHSLSAATLDGIPPGRLIQSTTDGNVALGAAAPTAGYRLEVVGSTILRPANGTVQFGSPNAELGMSITPTLGNRGDLRFDGTTLKLVAGSGVGPPSSTNGLAITTDGNIGMGTSTPFPGFRLDVRGPASFQPGGTGGGFISFATPSAETGMVINGSGNKRADVRFDGSTLKLLAADAAGPPGIANGMAITTTGNVGIGTRTPTSKLEIAGQDALNIKGYQPFVTLRDSNFSDSPARVQNVNGNLILTPSKFLAHSTLGPPALTVSASYGGSVGIGTTLPNAKLHVVGDAKQGSTDGGFVKAMASINPFLPAAQYVVRSYNSQPLAAPATITMERVAKGVYRIDFGFNVADRFVSLTPRSAGSGGYIAEAVGNRLTVIFGTEPFSTFDSAFDIIVY